MDIRSAISRQAEILALIRNYFESHDVLPVQTPVLSRYGTTDPSVSNMSVVAEEGESQGYLQTSPEFAMKRLLSKGSGDIYQICPAFRAGESGQLHCPEFSILEWYRIGFDHHQLMDDVEHLLSDIVTQITWRRISCATLFQEAVGINPHTASDDLLFTRANLSVDLPAEDLRNRALMLDVIFSEQIQPTLPSGEALFVYDYPVEQAAYARIRSEEPMVASRFELIIEGIEIANGYHEVIDAVEQARRHALERKIRATRSQTDIDVDPEFLAALGQAMPESAGVAIGLDRLIMLALGQQSIAEGRLL